jgi:hypothetical protein
MSGNEDRNHEKRTEENWQSANGEESWVEKVSRTDERRQSDDSRYSRPSKERPESRNVGNGNATRRDHRRVRRVEGSAQSTTDRSRVKRQDDIARRHSQDSDDESSFDSSLRDAEDSSRFRDDPENQFADDGVPRVESRWRPRSAKGPRRRKDEESWRSADSPTDAANNVNLSARSSGTSRTSVTFDERPRSRALDEEEAPAGASINDKERQRATGIRVASRTSGSSSSSTVEDEFFDQRVERSADVPTQLDQLSHRDSNANDSRDRASSTVFSDSEQDAVELDIHEATRSGNFLMTQKLLDAKPSLIR